MSEVESGSRFVYDKAQTEPIACAFPIARRDYYWRDGLLPFFEHLCPEGWLRGRQARAGRTSGEDDLGLLLHYGADCIGAVGILPPGNPVPFPLASSPDSAPDNQNNGEQAGITQGKTLSGVQKKLLVFKGDSGFQPTIAPDDPATYIAKFNREDIVTLVYNEDLSLKLGREILGVAEITEAQIEPLRGGEGRANIVLLVKRFDRHHGHRLRLEDFAQILDKPRGREFDGKYDSSYEEAATVIEKHSARAKIDLVRYFDLLIFNFVIGNADAHLKNFSLLERVEGLRFSPAYDLVNTLVYPDYERETALEIGGRKLPFEDLNKAVIEKLGAAIGLPSLVVDQSITKLAKKFANPKTLQFSVPVQPDDFRALYRDILFANAGRIFS